MLRIGKFRVFENTFMTLARGREIRVMAHEVDMFNGFDKAAREVRRVHGGGHC